MNTDFEDVDKEELEPEEEIDWLLYAQSEEEALRPLDGKDYIALCIASLQTIFLPLIILIFILIFFNFILQLLV
ncbi:hypothetical protein EU527_06375 [Candidatus Thorarchaeota archaeon]|nr:MAG: hypothetical protein EU527_06375 [Candidatus Thorarchaeota archaeon]